MVGKLIPIELQQKHLGSTLIKEYQALENDKCTFFSDIAIGEKEIRRLFKRFWNINMSNLIDKSFVVASEVYS